MSNEQRPAPGWYPHPSMAQTQRYWDGEHWTDQVAPAPAPQPPTMSTLKIARGVALGLAVVVAAIWFITSAADSSNEVDCLLESSERAARGEPALNCD